MKKVLVTGFGSFGDIDENPSQVLVEKLASRDRFPDGMELIAEILPVVYGESITIISGLIRKIRPEIVLSFGVAARRNDVCLERVALNLKDTNQPDNDGMQPDGELIFQDAPLAYFSKLPLPQLQEQLRNRRIPTSISNHAGAYICNTVFYTAAHEITSSGASSLFGFIHIPLITEKTSEKMPITISDLESAVFSVLEWLSYQ